MARTNYREPEDAAIMASSGVGLGMGAAAIARAREYALRQAMDAVHVTRREPFQVTRQRTLVYNDIALDLMQQGNSSDDSGNGHSNSNGNGGNSKDRANNGLTASGIDGKKLPDASKSQQQQQQQQQGGGGGAVCTNPKPFLRAVTFLNKAITLERQLAAGDDLNAAPPGSLAPNGDGTLPTSPKRTDFQARQTREALRRESQQLLTRLLINRGDCYRALNKVRRRRPSARPPNQPTKQP